MGLPVFADCHFLLAVLRIFGGHSPLIPTRGAKIMVNYSGRRSNQMRINLTEIASVAVALSAWSYPAMWLVSDHGLPPFRFLLVHFRILALRRPQLELSAFHP